MIDIKLLCDTGEWFFAAEPFDDDVFSKGRKNAFRNSLMNFVEHTKTLMDYPDEIVNSMTTEQIDFFNNCYTSLTNFKEKIVAKPQTIEVRMRTNRTSKASALFDVVIHMTNGKEITLDFKNNNRAINIYVYALTHPKGFYRRTLQNNNFKEIVDLYSKMNRSGIERFENSLNNDFDRIVSQAISQVRRAITQASREEVWKENVSLVKGAKELLYIPFVKNGGRVIIDDRILSTCRNVQRYNF